MSNKKENARISISRMAELKVDEAILNSIAKRENRKAKIIHSRCHCGNKNCGAMIVDINAR